MSHVEKFANENTDGTLPALRATAVGPVLATPAIVAAKSAAAFVAKTLVCAGPGGHNGREFTPAGPVPSHGSVNELLSVRVASIS